MTVSEQIIQVLDALCNKFGFAIDWTSENVIPYIDTLCTKLVYWEIWSSVSWIGIMAVLSVIAAIISAKLQIFSEDFYIDWDISGVLLTIFFISLWFATVLCVGTQIFDIVKCCTFPELFVFEYIQGIINS